MACATLASRGSILSSLPSLLLLLLLLLLCGDLRHRAIVLAARAKTRAKANDPPATRTVLAVLETPLRPISSYAAYPYVSLQEYPMYPSVYPELLRPSMYPNSYPQQYMCTICYYVSYPQYYPEYYPDYYQIYQEYYQQGYDPCNLCRRIKGGLPWAG